MKYLKKEDSVEQIISSLIEKFKVKSKKVNIHSEVLDPFSSIIEASLNILDYENWIKAETTRQHQKTLQNAIGRLHQELLGTLIDVEDLGIGNLVDILCKKKKIVAEIKTKHNTTKGDNKYTIYDELEIALNSTYIDYIGYYVEIIPKNPNKFDKPFTPNDKEGNKKLLREDIRTIDGKSFYELLTGDSQALEKINKKIVKILKDKYSLQDSEQFNKLFFRAYEVGFSIKEEIKDIENKYGIKLIEKEEVNRRKKLLWKHLDCEFKARLSEFNDDKKCIKFGIKL